MLSAANVQSDLRTLEGHVAALRIKQTVRDKDAGSVDPHYLPPEAPTQRAVGRAIHQARRKLRTGGSSSGDTSKAIEAILNEARALDGQASALCSTAGP